MEYLPSYYKDLEREVAELADQLAATLTPSERGWIAEWIEVGEYGLAVIAMLENLQRTADSVPAATVDHVREVASRIGLEKEVEKYRPR